MFVLRYVPNVVKEEYVNVGIIMVGEGFAEVRFAPDWRRVLVLDPDADIDLLTGLTVEIQQKLRGQPQEMLREMQDSWSNTVQLSPGKGYVTDDPATEIETLASKYL
jgi:CO dehydrogenase nickel-insertion accessory protein CooC1